MQHTCTSNVKYFFRFLMIITRKGSLMPSVFLGSAGQVMKVVLKSRDISYAAYNGKQGNQNCDNDNVEMQ